MSISPDIMNSTFKQTRIKALKYWRDSTKRKRYGNRDTIRLTMECIWQNKYSEMDSHISILCSLGEFVTNITDLLTDSRFDKCTFEDQGDILFRYYYTRILLVTSEVLTDFQNILQEIKCINKIKARELLNRSEASFTTDNLFNFINCICKHKVKGIHLKNHHAKITFKDNPKFIVTNDSESINIYNLNERLKDKSINKFIEVEKLTDFLSLIVNGYKVLELNFNDNQNEIENFYKKYKSPIHKNEL